MLNPDEFDDVDWGDDEPLECGLDDVEVCESCQ